ncbi:unnamed protein product [Discula destructiva]
MGSCLSKLTSRPKTASSSQSTVVGNESPPKASGGVAVVVVVKADDPLPPSSPSPDYPLPFGKPVLAEFQHDPDYHNLNHGSFGTVPKYMSAKLHHYQALAERAPDTFIRYTYPTLLDTNRAAIATFLNAPHVDEVVLVPNATVGVNTVLRELAGAPAAHPDGRDEILYFSTIYGACGKTVDYVADASHGRVTGRAIKLTYPLSDAAILHAFHAAVSRSQDEGKRPRVAVFDTVSSLPGARVPFAALVAACRERGVLSLVDAAQGVGMVALDLAALDADFLVSNCHKWLFVPRGCAVLYVPRRNQHLVRSTVPTSHGYVPLPGPDGGGNGGGGGGGGSGGARKNPLPPSSKSAFVKNFEYVGTLDNSPYLCVRDAIEWRERVLGGEERIRGYVTGLAQTGGDEVARALGTWVMRNEEGTMECGMVNVAMPLVVVGEGGRVEEVEEESGVIDEMVREADVEGAAPVHELGKESEGKAAAGGLARDSDTVIPHSDAERIWEWMTKVLVDEYKTFIPTYYHDGRFWARLSAQVYLDGDDFVWAGQTLKTLCERVARKEYDL